MATRYNINSKLIADDRNECHLKSYYQETLDVVVVVVV